MALTAGHNQDDHDSAPPLKVVNKKKRKSPEDHQNEGEQATSSPVKSKKRDSAKEDSKKVTFNEKLDYNEPEKKKRRKESGENDAGESAEGEGEANGKKKLNNKQLKKLKQKRKDAKKRKGEAKRQKKLEEGVVTPQKHRDFATDLNEYLEQWEEDKNSNSNEKKWKFNKVLQEWALQHCLQKQLVSSELFKRLTPYIATVQGKAKERLVTVLEEVMNREDETVPETAEGDDGETLAILRSIEKKRAKRLLPLLTA